MLQEISLWQGAGMAILMGLIGGDILTSMIQGAREVCY
jgi:hypothetical protein